MATFTVTIATDVVAVDGETSLREALVLATGPGDLIIFDPSLNDKTITLDPAKGALLIASGADVAIDGDIDDDGLADITIDGSNTTNLLSVAPGAQADITGFRFKDGYSFSSDGKFGDGQSGYDGQDGYDGEAGGYWGSYLGGAGGAGGYGIAGDAGVGTSYSAVLNRGTLTLRSVEFLTNSSRASGGDGGDGGDGGYGGYGGYGGDGYYGNNGGGGGGGGYAGDGGQGGFGGDAAGALLNSGNLTLIDVSLVGNTAFAGDGGRGGIGGDGGRGGDGGDGGDYYGTGYAGGDGGRGGVGGYGGDGGDGGDGVGGILNFGGVTATGNVAALNNTGDHGVGGSGGSGGSGGAGGYGGVGYGGAGDGSGGYDGDSGFGGGSGSDGQSAADFLSKNGGTGTLNTAPTTTFIALADTSQSEDAGGATTTYTFFVNRLGDLSGTTSVDVNFAGGAGVNGADFAGGLLPTTQTVTFTAGLQQKTVSIVVANDGDLEADETFALSLSNPTGMALGSTTVKTATIVNDDSALVIIDNDHAPVITSNGGGAAANVSVAENTTAVTTVAATDADGDALTYAIKAGGDGALFKLDPTTHALSFKAAPDFEAPADAGANNIYDVTVQASDGANVDTQLLHVSVTNVAGVTIHGSKKNDKIDATHAPAGQPLPTNEEDTISGGRKNDDISGLGGNDTLSGGRSKFKEGKPKGVNKLTGDDGADNFLFGSKLQRSKTKVMDFDSAEGDKVLLAKSIFDDYRFKDGDISENDFQKLFDYTKHGTLKYDGEKVAKFVGAPDLHADDFMLV